MLPEFRQIFDNAPAILKLKTDAGFYHRWNLDNLSYIIFGFQARLRIFDDDGTLRYGILSPISLSPSAPPSTPSTPNLGRRSDQLPAALPGGEQDQGLAHGSGRMPHHMVGEKNPNSLTLHISLSLNPHPPNLAGRHSSTSGPRTPSTATRSVPAADLRMYTRREVGYIRREPLLATAATAATTATPTCHCCHPHPHITHT